MGEDNVEDGGEAAPAPDARGLKRLLALGLRQEPPATDADGVLIRQPFDTHRIGLVLLGLAALAVLVLAGSLLQQARDLARTTTSGGEHVTTLTATSTESRQAAALIAARQTVDAQIAVMPDYRRFFSRLKTLFPADYDAILNRLAGRAAEGSSPGDPDLWITEAVHRLRTSHGILAAKSDSPALSRVFEMQLAMMRALAATDQHLCVDFLYGTPGADFYKFSATNRGLVADMALAGLEAMEDGRQKRIDRTPPTDADFALLESALASRGLSKPEIDAILDGKAADPPIEDARMCAVGQIYLETLAALPEPARVRIYALAVELMARS